MQQLEKVHIPAMAFWTVTCNIGDQQLVFHWETAWQIFVHWFARQKLDAGHAEQHLIGAMGLLGPFHWKRYRDDNLTAGRLRNKKQRDINSVYSFFVG